MANTDEDVKKPLPQRLQDQATQLVDATQSSQAWNSIFDRAQSSGRATPTALETGPT
jgi:hypothetical protein